MIERSIGRDVALGATSLLMLGGTLLQARPINAENSRTNIPNQDNSHSLYIDNPSLVDQTIENARLNIPNLRELQQNPSESYWIKTSFVDNRTTPPSNVFLGVTNVEPGISPNPACAVPSVHVYNNNNFVDRFQLNGENYNICRVGVGSISVTQSGIISLGVAEEMVGSGRIFLRGGTAVNYYGNWRDWNTQIRLPDEGIGNFEVSGIRTGGTVNLSFIEEASRSYHLLSVTAATVLEYNGNYTLDALGSGYPLSTRWSGPIIPNLTSTPTETRKATVTRTSTLQPTNTPEPIRTPTLTTTTGSLVRAVSLTENPVEFSWQNMPNTAANVIVRSRGSSAEVLSVLPATTTSFRDNTLSGEGELACYTRLAVGFAGENLGLSNLICSAKGTRSATGYPEGVKVSLEGNMVRFFYALTPAESRALYVAIPSTRIIPGAEGATSISYDSQGQINGALLLALRGGTVSGNSNFFVTISLARN